MGEIEGCWCAMGSLWWRVGKGATCDVKWSDLVMWSHEEGRCEGTPFSPTPTLTPSTHSSLPQYPTLTHTTHLTHPMHTSCHLPHPHHPTTRTSPALLTHTPSQLTQPIHPSTSPTPPTPSTRPTACVGS